MKLLLLGSTGLVGRNVLTLALADPRVHGVVAPVRRTVPGHPKLLAPIVDYEHLPEDETWWRADAVICTLGTTMRAAGSREAFRKVDHDYTLAAARLARRHGTPAFVLNSALGANPASSVFYNKVKGEVERDVGQLGFSSLTIVRPGLIGGTRQETRPAERAAILAARILHPLLPRQWRINPAEAIARAMLDAAVAARPGQRTINSAELA
jgi:uncharacterized protein YbjT (DUF2867 family)